MSSPRYRKNKKKSNSNPTKSIAHFAQGPTPAVITTEVEKAADPGRYFAAGNGRGSYSFSEPSKNQMRTNYNYWLLYRQSKWVQRCIDTIARAASKEYTVKPVDPKAEADSNLIAPIMDFLNHPNANDTSFNQLLFKVVRDVMLFGCAFLELRLQTLSQEQAGMIQKAMTSLGVMSDANAEQVIASLQGTGIPNVLNVLPNFTMEIVSDKRGNVLGYKQHTPTGDVIEFGSDEVVRIIAPHSMDPLYGDTSLSSIVLDASIGMKIAQRQYAKLENEVAFDKLFTMKNGGNDTETKRLRENILNEYAGAKAAGNFLVIGDDTEVTDLAKSTDGDYLALAKDVEAAIAKALGVPMAILEGGAGNALSDGGHDGAWQLFIENTVEPIAQHVQASIDLHVISKFIVIGIDGYELDIITESKNDDTLLEKKYDMMIRNGTKTVAEIRKMRGDEEYSADDKPIFVAGANATLLENIQDPAEPVAPAVPIAPGTPARDPALTEGKPELDELHAGEKQDVRSTLRAIRKALE